MKIITRASKGSELTHEEMDGNFTNLKDLASGNKNISRIASNVSPTNTIEFSFIDTASVDVSDVLVDTVVCVFSVSGSIGILDGTILSKNNFEFDVIGKVIQNPYAPKAFVFQLSTMETDFSLDATETKVAYQIGASSTDGTLIDVNVVEHRLDTSGTVDTSISIIGV